MSHLLAGQLLGKNVSKLTKSNPVNLDFYDDFITADAAPITSPRTTEPGGQMAVITDTAADAGIASGLFTWDAATVNNSDPRYLSQSTFARAAGRAAMMRAKTVGRAQYGLGEANTVSPATHYFFVVGAASFLIGTAAGGYDQTALTNTEYYKYGAIMRGTGAFLTIKGGSQHPTHRLIWVDNATATAQYLGFGVANGAGQNDVDWIKSGLLSAPWNTTYGPGALAVSGAIPAGQTFTHEANCLIYFTVTNNGSAGNTDIFFRVQDATNYWHLQIANDGSATLNEVVASVPTSRGTAAAGVFANGERCCIQAIGSAIRIYDGAAVRITYTSATNFATATSGELDALATGATFSNLEVYPTDLSGEALRWLNNLESAPF